MAKKQLIISVIAILGIFIPIFFFSQAFWFSDNRGVWIDWVYVGLGMLVFGAEISVSMMLLSRRYFVAVWLINLVIILALAGFKIYLLAAFGALFLSIYFGFRVHLIEEKTRLKLQIFWILSRSVPTILTGICFAVAVTYFISPSFGAFNFNVSVPRPLFNSVWQFVAPQFLDEQFKNMEKIGGEFGGQFELAIQIPSEKELKEEAYKRVNGAVTLWFEKTLGGKGSQYLSILFIIAVFFGLRAFGIPLTWLIVFLSWVIIKILIITGVAKIEKVPAEKENLILD